MDPITIILEALAVGVKATIGDAVKDTYNGLKTLIQRKFSDKAEANMALNKYEEKPEVWKAPLEDSLKEAAAEKDEEIIKAAQKLLEQAKPEEAAEGKFKVIFQGTVEKIGAVGDNAKVDMRDVK